MSMYEGLIASCASCAFPFVLYTLGDFGRYGLRVVLVEEHSRFDDRKLVGDLEGRELNSAIGILESEPELLNAQVKLGTFLGLAKKTGGIKALYAIELGYDGNCVIHGFGFIHFV